MRSATSLQKVFTKVINGRQEEGVEGQKEDRRTITERQETEIQIIDALGKFTRIASCLKR